MEVEGFKNMIATKGDLKLEVNLTSKEVCCIKTTMKMRPKNRKQKKLWKQESYRMKKVDKGLYEVTQCCSFSTTMFAMIMQHVIRDENGEPWFLEDKK